MWQNTIGMYVISMTKNAGYKYWIHLVLEWAVPTYILRWEITTNVLIFPFLDNIIL